MKAKPEMVRGQLGQVMYRAPRMSEVGLEIPAEIEFHVGDVRVVLHSSDGYELLWALRAVLNVEAG